MRDLYCDCCNEETVHNKHMAVYYCVICMSSNYCIDEIDHPEEIQGIKDLQNKLIEETGFPF